MGQVIPINRPPGQIKSLSADVYLITAYSDSVGWALDCFVSDVDSLDEALSFAAAERPHLADQTVLATQVGEEHSLMKQVRLNQPPPPPPEITLVDIPDAETP